MTAANLGLTLALLLDTSQSSTNAAPSGLARSASVREFARALADRSAANEPSSKKNKKVASKESPRGLRVLCYMHKPLCLDSSATTAFIAEESRPSFATGADGAGILTNQSYGLRVKFAARLVPGAETGAQAGRVGESPRQAELGWDGAFTWSQDLLAKWERYAFAAYTAAAKIPGITYQSEVEDEDGFINSRDGTDVSGLFRKKRKPTEPPPESAGPAATGEPSYRGDTAVLATSLSGRCTFAEGDLIVERIPSVRPDGKVAMLYFVLQARLTD